MNNPLVRLEVVRVLKIWPWLLGVALLSLGLAQAMTIEPATTIMRNYCSRVLVGGCYLNVITFGMVLAVLSGTSLASERNHGTILFLCRLPVTKTQIYLAKAAFLLLFGGSTLIVLRGMIELNYLWSDKEYLGNVLIRMPDFLWFLPSYLMIACVGISVSVMSSNPATSAFLAFLSPIVLGSLLAYIRHESAWLSGIQLLPIFALFGTILAVACLSLGAIHFCRSED